MFLKCSDFKTFLFCRRDPFFKSENLYQSLKQINGKTDKTRDVLGLGVGKGQVSLFAGHLPSIIPGPWW